MIDSRHLYNGTRYLGLLGPAVIYVMLLTAGAYAQAVESPPSVPSVMAGPISVQNLVKPHVRTDPPSLLVGLDRQPTPVPQTAPAAKPRSIRRKVLGAIVAATGGFFAGGFLGAKIEGNRCGCDDPGLVGFLVGAPVGGVTGGILGYKFLF